MPDRLGRQTDHFNPQNHKNLYLHTETLVLFQITQNLVPRSQLRKMRVKRKTTTIQNILHKKQKIQSIVFLISIEYSSILNFLLKITHYHTSGASLILFEIEDVNLV
jgi:hypothetical protein